MRALARRNAHQTQEAKAGEWNGNRHMPRSMGEVAIPLQAQQTIGNPHPPQQLDAEKQQHVRHDIRTLISRGQSAQGES